MPGTPGRRRTGKGTRGDHQRKRVKTILYETDRPVRQRSMPTRYPDGEWTKPARAWWRTWALSPQATLFIESDWDALEKVLPLLEDFYETRNPRLHEIVRRTEERLGGTIGDRERMGLEIRKVDTSAPLRSVEVERLPDPRKEAQ